MNRYSEIKTVDDLERCLVSQLTQSSGGYLAAVEDILCALSSITGSEAWKQYLQDQEQAFEESMKR